MTFIIDKKTTAPDVILFRRGAWQLVLPREAAEDRPLQDALPQTDKITEARELASDHASPRSSVGEAFLR